MIRQELYTLRAALMQMSRMPGVKVAYMVAKNRRKIDAEIKAMESGLIVGEGDPIAKYDDARLQLCKEYAEKDPAGEPVIIKEGKEQGNFKIPDEKRAEFEQGVTQLKTIYKDALDARDALVKSYEKMCKEELPSKFVEGLHRIALKELPNNITGEQMMSLGDLVVDEGSLDVSETGAVGTPTEMPPSALQMVTE
jgi:hypothetical protein